MDARILVTLPVNMLRILSCLMNSFKLCIIRQAMPIDHLWY